MDDFAGFESAFNGRYTLITRKILRMLSQDSRTPVTEIANKANVSRRTAKARIGGIEKALKVRYTLELDEEALGITNSHLIVARFPVAPDYDEVAGILRQSYIPQLAVRSKSGHELFIYANSPSHSEYTRWDKTTQSIFSKYGALWESSEAAHRQLGFFPLRNELLDRLKIAEKYKTTLKLLNRNSRISLRGISKATGMHFNTVAYNFKKLVGLGYIKKFTLTCVPPKELCLLAIFGKYALAEGFEADASKIRAVFKGDEELSAFSRYPLILQLIGAYDYFDVGLFDNLGIGKSKFVAAYRTLLGRHLAKLAHRELSEAILGDLPIRSVDDSKEYNVIRWTTGE